MENIIWEPLPDDDPDYQVLEALKMEAGDLSSNDDAGEDENQLAGDFQKLPKDQRDELLRQVSEATGASQSRLAELADLNQATVSRILRGES